MIENQIKEHLSIRAKEYRKLVHAEGYEFLNHYKYLVNDAIDFTLKEWPAVNKYDDEWEEPEEYAERFGEAIDTQVVELFRELGNAVYRTGESGSAVRWSHQAHWNTGLATSDHLMIDDATLCDCTAKYLANDWRNKYMDYLLVDALAFIPLQTLAKTKGTPLARSLSFWRSFLPRTNGPIPQIIIEFLTLMIGSSLISSPFWILNHLEIIGESWSIGVTSVIFGLAALLLLYELIMLPRTIYQDFVAQQFLGKVGVGVVCVYESLSSNPTHLDEYHNFSADRISTLVNRPDLDGPIYPKEMHLLLEDIKKRGGIFGQENEL